MKLKKAFSLRKFKEDCKKQATIAKRIDCLIDGHIWATEPSDELGKPIKKRTYCKRCGKYYAEEIYKDKD